METKQPAPAPTGFAHFFVNIYRPPLSDAVAAVDRGRLGPARDNLRRLFLSCEVIRIYEQ
jgi:hypothetical protein